MVSHTLLNTEEKMRKSLELLAKELLSIRTGRATPTLIEHIKVDYSGVPLPLNKIASISAPETNLLVIQPWDRESISSIEKAILKSDLGLTPISDGNMIRINIPLLTEERRNQLIKMVRRRVEERRIALRNIRHEAINLLKGLEKDKDISQDEYKRSLSQLQKLIDNFIVEAEQMGQAKEAELAEV